MPNILQTKAPPGNDDEINFEEPSSFLFCQSSEPQRKVSDLNKPLSHSFVTQGAAALFCQLHLGHSREGDNMLLILQ